MQAQWEASQTLRKETMDLVSELSLTLTVFLYISWIEVKDFLKCNATNFGQFLDII